jgi:hypothetical protein
MLRDSPQDLPRTTSSDVAKLNVVDCIEPNSNLGPGCSPPFDNQNSVTMY